jgi:hypothetical protein
VAGADEALLALFREFGRHIGMAAQFDNDMHDVWAAVAAGDAWYPLADRTPPTAAAGAQGALQDSVLHSPRESPPLSCAPKGGAEPVPLMAALAIPGGPQLEVSDPQGAWKTTQGEVPPRQRSAKQNPSGVLDDSLGAKLRPARAKSDLHRGKQTVPLAFLRDSPGRAQLRQHEALAEQLWETGALPYAWALVQVHREKAREVLARIDGAGAEPGLALSVLGDVIGGTTEDPRRGPRAQDPQRGPRSPEGPPGRGTQDGSPISSQGAAG